MILRRLPSLPHWPNALGELDEMRRGMERLFDSLAGAAGTRTAGLYPPINVSETPESVLVRAEMPGVRAEALEVTVEHDTLTLVGERAMPVEDDRVSYHRQEREWGKFRRSLSIPVPVDPNRVEARYRDGVLTVALPKAPEVRPKRIAVRAEN